MDIGRELARVDSLLEGLLEGTLDPSRVLRVEVCEKAARVWATRDGHTWQLAGDCMVEVGRVLFTPEIQAKIAEIRATPHRPPAAMK